MLGIAPLKPAGEEDRLGFRLQLIGWLGFVVTALCALTVAGVVILLASLNVIAATSLARHRARLALGLAAPPGPACCR